MIQLEKFKESVSLFDAKEARTNFFSLAQNLIRNGFEVEGLLLILTTWNFAIFRYAVKTFDIEDFRIVLNHLKPNFDRLKGEDFQTINFEIYKTDISKIYSSLSKIKGIEFTGAPKIMHQKKPKVFVMWDAYIRGEKARKYYDALSLPTEIFLYKKYDKSFDGYFEFLKEMQEKFKHLNFVGEKPLAKAVDEFNYVNITLAIQEMEKRKKKR